LLFDEHCDNLDSVMATKTDSVLLSLGVPFDKTATRATFPSTMKIRDCVQQISDSNPTSETERRVVQQLRREVAGSRFDILLIQENGAKRVDPNADLGSISAIQEVPTPGGVEKLPVVQVEVQAYTPVAAV
jgi:PAB1-binding protein PBP1